MEKNISKVRAHDAIVGMTYLISVLGSMFVNTNLIYLAIGVGFLQIISPFSKFCPKQLILLLCLKNSFLFYFVICLVFFLSFDIYIYLGITLL